MFWVDLERIRPGRQGELGQAPEAAQVRVAHTAQCADQTLLGIADGILRRRFWARNGERHYHAHRAIACSARAQLAVVPGRTRQRREKHSCGSNELPAPHVAPPLPRF